MGDKHKNLIGPILALGLFGLSGTAAGIGNGSSNWTWQAILAAGYRFDRGDVTLAVRSLSYDFDKDDADIRLTGPGLGAGFRW